jgi:hypothetical protein
MALKKKEKTLQNGSTHFHIWFVNFNTKRVPPLWGNILLYNGPSSTTAEILVGLYIPDEPHLGHQGFTLVTYS